MNAHMTFELPVEKPRYQQQQQQPKLGPVFVQQIQHTGGRSKSPGTNAPCADAQKAVRDAQAQLQQRQM